MNQKGTIIIIILLVLLIAAIAFYFFVKRKQLKEAEIESFLGTKNPRGIRNNNPSNIIRTNSLWLGEISHNQSTDTTFKQFTKFSFGTYQMIDLLIDYFSKGRNTIRKIIENWTRGESAQKQANYMNFLKDKTGFGIDEILTPNKSTLEKLCNGIVNYENGIDFLTSARFEAGYNIYLEQTKTA